MKKKITGILSILLFLLLLGSYGTCYAVSTDTMIEFIEQVHLSRPSNNTASKLYEYKNGLIWNYINANIPIENYNAFAWTNNATSNMGLYLWNDPTERKILY